MPTKLALDKLTLQQLEATLEYHHFDELKKEFDQSKIDELFHYFSQKWAEKKALSPLPNSKNTAHGIASALKLFVIPIDTFWLITSSIQLIILGSIALPITLSVLFISTALFCYKMYDAYEEQKKEEKETEEFFAYAELQREAMQELTKRKQQDIENLRKKLGYQLEPLPISNKKFAADFPQDCQLSKMHSIGAGAMVAVSLLLSSIAVTSIFQTLGYLTLASLLINPIVTGVIIGLLVIAFGVVGIYVGYQHYQERKEKELKIRAKNNMTSLIQEEKKEYLELSQAHHDLVLEEKIRRNIEAEKDKATTNEDFLGSSKKRSGFSFHGGTGKTTQEDHQKNNSFCSIL